MDRYSANDPNWLLSIVSITTENEGEDNLKIRNYYVSNRVGLPFIIHIMCISDEYLMNGYLEYLEHLLKSSEKNGKIFREKNGIEWT